MFSIVEVGPRGMQDIKGTRRSKVAACAKHFVGDGGIDENNTVTDKKGLFGIHMPAYYNAVNQGVATVMVSYFALNGLRMHANKELVTGFLKNKLKFRGFVITNPPHLNYSASVYAGISAGIDMIMVPYNYTEFIDEINSQIKKKLIPISRIDDAVKRIL